MWSRDDTKVIDHLVKNGVPIREVSRLLDAQVPATWSGPPVKVWPGREDDIPRALAHAEANGLRVITLENGDTFTMPKEFPKDNPYRNSRDMSIPKKKRKG